MSVSLAEPILGNERKKRKVLLIFLADLERFITVEKTTIYTTVDYKAKVRNIVLIYKNPNICAVGAISVEKFAYFLFLRF